MKLKSSMLIVLSLVFNHSFAYEIRTHEAITK
jgi:hypothetical protein